MPPAALMSLLLLLITTSIQALMLPLELQNRTAPHLLQLSNTAPTAANPTLTYRVPETDTVLYINYFPYFQISRQHLMAAINNIRTRMTSHVKEKGDGWLLATDDPIIERISSGERGEEWWNVVIQSSPVTKHLTYGVVLEVMEGWENVIKGQVGPCQMFAAIQDVKRGQVGRMRMYPSREVMSQ